MKQYSNPTCLCSYKYSCCTRDCFWADSKLTQKSKATARYGVALWLPVSMRSCQSQLTFVFNRLQKHLGFAPLLLGMPHWWKNILEISFLFPHGHSNVRENKIRIVFFFFFNFSGKLQQSPSLSRKDVPWIHSGYLPYEISYFSVAGVNTERHSGKSPGLCPHCRREALCIFTPKDRNS